jgi:hypothetical protein
MTTGSLITILTGPSAAGKNTVGYTYARQFSPKCAVIDGDQVRWMYTQPHIAPWHGEEGLRQHQIGVQHGAMLARSFVGLGLEVVVLDVLWADLAARYRSQLAGLNVRIVRLLPTLEECLRRHHQRPPSISDEEVKWTYNHTATLTDYDLTLDTTDLAAEQVASWLRETAQG